MRVGLALHPLAELAQIAPRHEMPARPPDQHRAHGVIGFGPIGRLDQKLAHRRRRRVHLGGSVEREDRETILHFVQERRHPLSFPPPNRLHEIVSIPTLYTKHPWQRQYENKNMELETI